MKKRSIRAVIAALLAVLGPVALFAAPPKPTTKPLTELYGSVGFSQNSDLSTLDAAVDLELPLGHYFAAGPLATYDAVRPKGEGWTAETAVGGVLVANFSDDHLGPYCSVGATALTSDFHGWTLLPECGFKFGTSHLGFRVGAQHALHYNVGDSPVDLEGTRVAGAFGARW